MSWETGTATDYLDLLEKLDTFLVTNGKVFGLTYAGTGNGVIAAPGGTTGSPRGGASSVAETFTITATSATNFDVVGSVSGDIGDATAGSDFSHAKLAFRITVGGTAFIAGDVFTLSTAPKATSMRKCRGPAVTASSGTTGAGAAENVIDGKTASDTSRDWNASEVSSIEFLFPAAETIAELAIMCTSSTLTPRDFTLDYWNGSSWVNLITQTAVATWAVGEVKTFAVGSPSSQTRYRVNVTDGNSASGLSIGAIELRRTVGGLNAAFSQYIWELPGNNGTSEIYVGIHHLRRVDVDYYDWELAAFDGHNAALAFYAQPGLNSSLFVPLANASMTYWWYSDGRHVRGVVKIGSQYEPFYLGFYDSYHTPEQMPYPMCLGGAYADGVPPDTWESTAYRYQNSANTHRAFTHSDPDSGTAVTGYSRYQMRARGIDGVWYGFGSSHADDLTDAPSAAESAIWPYCGDLQLFDANLDGSYELLPVVLFQTGPNVLGSLSGIACVSGQGLSAETAITIGPITWLAFPNINRVDRNDWFAFRLG